MLVCTFLKEGKITSMVLLVPSLPLTPSGAAAFTFSPLSTHPRPRQHPLPSVCCCACQTPPPTAVSKDAASWARKLTGVVPWKAVVSSTLALTLSFSCCKLSWSLSTLIAELRSHRQLFENKRTNILQFEE